MADTQSSTAPDGANSGGADAQGTKAPTLEELQTQFAELQTKFIGVVEENNRFKKEQSDLIRERQEAKNKARTAETEKAAKEGDIEKLRTSYEDQLKEHKARIDELIGGQQKSEAIRALLEVTGNDAKKAEVAYLLLKEHLELKTDDKGNTFVRVRDDAASVEQFAKKQLASTGHSFLIASGRVGGTDTTPPNGRANGAVGATEIPADFGIWDGQRKREWMSKNPKLAAEAAAQALRSSVGR